MSHMNVWTNNSLFLKPAYLRLNNSRSAKLIMLAIQRHMSNLQSNIVDIGSGDGCLLALFAQNGHMVTAVDIDSDLLKIVKNKLKKNGLQKTHFRLIEGTIDCLMGEKFDVVCCHSVLLYEEKWRDLVKKLVCILNPGGIISISTVNPESEAMRLGLQGRWREAIATISTRKHCDVKCIPSVQICRDQLQHELESAGIQPLEWQGLGVFESVNNGDEEERFTAEWLAGTTDPYRGIARCYHLIGKKPMLDVDGGT